MALYNEPESHTLLCALSLKPYRVMSPDYIINEIIGQKTWPSPKEEI